MKSKKTDEMLKKHKEKAIKCVSDYLDSLLESKDYKIKMKADKLCYWFEDYMKFLEYEKEFKPKSLKRYKRGEIIKAHLGYNIGSEEGGLHYCVVLDKNNSVNSPVITVVPLTSVKENTDIENLHLTEVYLEDELYVKLSSKISNYSEKIDAEHRSLDKEITVLLKEEQLNVEKINELRGRLDNLLIESNLVNRMKNEIKNEIKNMKKGSIALVNQITTISKIRIYDPKRNDDVLSKIRLSNEKLDLIDNVISNKYSNLSKTLDNNYKKI